ncbi:Transglutaminase-like superfamily protein [Shewanella psychrophila]|uniref:Transglutaminase-like superfamily protein n=1 Tax=Shewanella psychrophila TaxID=225848 RepID=A0A1S6HNU0_9GAMM|nr:transglutaminase-like domain-containing protein [Shewanella psychrophila]AQS37172.1 Transglutaminase-like superfamily protein [Shewanella psychrophila]
MKTLISKHSEITKQHLQTTAMLDFEHPSIQNLVDKRGWAQLSQYDAIGAIYTYVRDEIRFGYNADDRLSASQVLKDGYGQCNTKGTLLMALLRAVGIPSRFHGFTIFNELQRGAIPNYLFAIAPQRIIHSWVEVELDGGWINLEGYIIDRDYLTQVQQSFSQQCKQFSGYGISTKCLSNPDIDWKGQDTYIQSEGIADDFGLYIQPDDFYVKYGSNLSGIKKFLFRYLLRHLMNRNVNRIRAKGI